MNARPRVALIGCERIGQIHLRMLIGHPERCEFAALVDADEAAVRLIATGYRLDMVSTDSAVAFDDAPARVNGADGRAPLHLAIVAETSRLLRHPVAIDEVPSQTNSEPASRMSICA